MKEGRKEVVKSTKLTEGEEKKVQAGLHDWLKNIWLSQQS
jgi:hypothetical protein